MSWLSPMVRPALARGSRRFALVLAAILPLVLCLVLTRYESAGIARREAQLASAFIVNQTVAIVQEGRSAAQIAIPIAVEPCDKAMPKLAVLTAALPYIRTLNLVENSTFTCSSALGRLSIPLDTFVSDAGRATGGTWMLMVGETPMVRDRQSLLIGEPAPDGRAVVAVVDERYLLDLLRAAAPLDVFRQAELRIGAGQPLYEGSSSVPVDGSPLLTDVRRSLGGNVVELRIYGLKSRERAIWFGLLARYVPWAIAISVLLVWLLRRLQRSGQSRREQLLRGMRANEFHVKYQPLYGMEAGRCTGAEALLRWVRPGIGEVRPDEFIPVAEEEHVIVPITQHLLGLIARDLAVMGLPEGFHIGINFSPEHLSGERLEQDVRALLSATGKAGPGIVVEITERSLMKNTAQAKKNLETLRAEGVGVAIDDFGTGYCSLSYLEQFPFDILKIDRGFVLTIDAEGRSAVVLDAIINLAHQLGAQIVAEGVETQAQFDYLRARGVTFIQGFLYATPMTPAAFAQWYRAKGKSAFPETSSALAH
ncbi:EAL domain-containing protein [Paraburkholderia sp. B3]|uniref:EAL domain-containing protein n=1 Tax=Paraburkholderia sp. B3 TaxID=3134791 RepID=UPI003981B187